jgi:DNA-directed RNA polymerase subunit RPC12/RpoP
MFLNYNGVTEIIDKHYTLKCPHCNSISSLTAISIPDYYSLIRYKLNNVGIVYKCNACNYPVFLKFKVDNYDPPNNRIQISNNYETVENPLETFEFEFLPEPVRSDFKEALACYSIKAYNAFSSMCRRTIQSAANELGVKGNDKVQKQILEMKEMSNIDEETYNILKQIIVDGHDGAHPHLPTLSPSRADILLELIKDVMYQLFVRKGKLAKAAELRGQQIKSSKQ